MRSIESPGRGSTRRSRRAATVERIDTELFCHHRLRSGGLMTRFLPFLLLLFTAGACAGTGDRASGNADSARESVEQPLRELAWDTYLDKVQGAWMGKMIGVTFGQPWEFQYQNTPIGFDITDWPLSPTRMKDYRQRATNKPGDWIPITSEAEDQQVHILHDFIIGSEKEHPSFGIPDNDD